MNALSFAFLSALGSSAWPSGCRWGRAFQTELLIVSAEQAVFYYESTYHMGQGEPAFRGLEPVRDLLALATTPDEV